MMRMENEVVLTKEKLRELQLTELEMIVEVDRICHKNGIKYSLDGGTLLGAVRHKGFIPWDDDVDLIFTRAEYNKFFDACEKDLDKDRFFLQDYKTDSYYRWGYAKIRRNGTEFVRLGQEHMRYKTGVAIDLFVLDAVPDGYLSRRAHYLLNYAIRKILYSELGKKAQQNIWLRRWYSFLSLIPRDWCFLLRDSVSNVVNSNRRKLVAHLLHIYPNACKFGIPTDIFDEYEEITFEGMMFPAVKEYDKYLTLLYGDYMTLPPVEERVSHLPASDIRLLPITWEKIKAGYRA